MLPRNRSFRKVQELSVNTKEKLSRQGFPGCPGNDTLQCEGPVQPLVWKMPRATGQLRPRGTTSKARVPGARALQAEATVVRCTHRSRAASHPRRSALLATTGESLHAAVKTQHCPQN